MSALDFEECLKECIDQNDKIISELQTLKDDVIYHHSTCNTVKTVGTVASTTGTGILVASLIAVPITGGISLLGTAGGLVLSVGGGATTITTDFVDSLKTKNTIKTVEEFVESKHNINNRLQQHFDSIKDMEQLLVNNGISHEDSLCTILTGIANGSVDRLDEVSPSGPIVRLFTNMSRLSHAEELIFQTSHFGIKGLEKIASKVLPALGISGQIGANTIKNLSRFATVFSVAMTAVDIALLIRDWSSNHPAIEVIDDVIVKVTQENEYLNEIYSLIDALKERIHYVVIDGIPIVGATDIFNQVIVHLLNNEAYKCPDLLKNNYEIEHSFKDLQISENIALLLTKETDAACGFDKEQAQSIIEKVDKHIGKAIWDLVKNLLQNLKEYEKSETDDQNRRVRDEHVINNKVVLLFREIIEKFVQKTYNCSFSELTQIPTESVVYNDFHNPLTDPIRANIEDIMIAKMPDNVWYINSNAIIYGFLINILRESAALHMTSLFNTDDIGDTDHSTKIIASIYLLNQFRIYVDEFALQYWLTHSGGNRTTFDECRGAVQGMLQILYEKLRVWVMEIRRYHPNRLYPEL